MLMRDGGETLLLYMWIDEWRRARRRDSGCNAHWFSHHTFHKPHQLYTKARGPGGTHVATAHRRRDRAAARGTVHLARTPDRARSAGGRMGGRMGGRPGIIPTGARPIAPPHGTPRIRATAPVAHDPHALATPADVSHHPVNHSSTSRVICSSHQIRPRLPSNTVPTIFFMAPHTAA